MADRIFFVPGGPDFLRGFGLPPQMLKDLHAISAIPPDRIDPIATAIENEVGFLSQEQLERLVQGIVGNEDQASAVVGALFSLQPDQAAPALAMLREWRGASPQNAQRFSDEAFAAIEEKLPRLIREYPVVERSRKATRLKSILGNRAESVELICDMRPVFNSARNAVEGIIPLLTLKIGYEGQDDGTRVLEVNLSREMLTELLDKCQKARQKLQVLGQSVPHWIANGLAQFEE